MDLLLWRWSTAVQVTSVAMVVVFFTVLRRSGRRDAIDWWIAAWSANLLALTVTLAFWYLEPAALAVAVIRGLYLAGKTAFVLLLIQGAWAVVRPGARLVPSAGLAAALAAYGLAGVFLLGSVPQVGVVQHAVMGLLLLGGAAVLAAASSGTLAWLVAGLTVRGLLSLTEMAAYLSEVRAPDTVDPRVATFLAAHSSFDTAAEWLIVLGSVLALSERAQHELRQTNQRLLEASEGLRQLADRDPLTTLANRRALPDVFRLVQPTGAVLLFFDLDGFKRINDRYGHLAGDECLRRFGAALRESFRPQDAVLRYGGDEFLVVAGGMDRAAALARVRALGERLRQVPWRGPRIGFSVGISELAPGGQPEAALKEADAAMYQSKPGRQGPAESE
jgi:diguanylate cyclase (GGDEF)-like protein